MTILNHLFVTSLPLSDQRTISLSLLEKEAQRPPDRSRLSVSIARQSASRVRLRP